MESDASLARQSSVPSASPKSRCSNRALRRSTPSLRFRPQGLRAKSLPSFARHPPSGRNSKPGSSRSEEGWSNGASAAAGGISVAGSVAATSSGYAIESWKALQQRRRSYSRAASSAFFSFLTRSERRRISNRGGRARCSRRRTKNVPRPSTAKYGAGGGGSARA